MAESRTKLQYKDEQHEKAFKAFIQEADLEMGQIKQLDEVQRRQLAFLYVLAMYQKDYVYYEGEAFYVEALEEWSLGGPTYLLDDRIGELKRPHEQILPYAKALLRDEKMNEEESPDERWLLEALLLAEGKKWV